MKTRFWIGKFKRRITKHRTLVRSIFLASILGLVFFAIFSLMPPIISLAKNLLRGPSTAFSVIKDPSVVLRSTKGRTNVLLMGMGGKNHKGSQLTDSLIVLSIDLGNRDVVGFSIPRDIWISSLKTKINSVFFYGEQKKEDSGLVLAKAAIEEIIGQPIHYAITLDFEGFKRAVDLIGGIDVEVPESFDDYKYPVPGMEEAEPEDLRYEHLHFDKGWQTLSGVQALRYVRSRNAEGVQGTDFARSKRQQQVLIAFKNKVWSLETILSPKKVVNLMNTFSDSVYTDLIEQEYISLAKLALQTDQDEIRFGLLNAENKETGEEGLLVNPPAGNYDGQWVLTGRDGSWEQVHNYVESLFYKERNSL